MNLTEIKELLNKYDANALKKYGQNFLINDHVLETIANTLKGKYNNVVEIGPGLGSLTRYLVSTYEKVLSFEIDPKMVEILQSTINESNLNAGVEIKSQLDILKVGTSEYLFNGLGVVIGEAGKSAIIGQAVSDTGVSGTAGDAGQVDVYFLPIAKRSGGKWVAITSDDSINERRWSEQSILATNIMIDAPVINGEKQTLSTANNYYDKPQDLSTWLNYNYVIDDGEIK